MGALHVSICRWMLATCVIFGELWQSESLSFTRKPADPTVVVEGVNSTQVPLVWNFTDASSFVIIIKRRNITEPTESATAIASRFHSDSAFNVENSDYEAILPVTLVIKNATRNDEYVYSVAITGFAPLVDIFDEVTVNVLYRPEFKSNVSDNQVVIEGGPSIILNCAADGKPTPVITWTRVLDNGSDSSVLFTGEEFVLNNNRSSIGTYRCTAFNGIGTTPNRTIAVDVNYEPENVKLTVNDSNVCKGDIINITCSADGKPSVHTYQLFENDMPVPDSNTAGVWKRTMSAQGSFTYRCVANNTVGTSEKNVTVAVNVPAVVYPLENITVTEGENRNLTCNVSGSPTVSVTWTEVKTGNRTMGITRGLIHINRDESGEYKCEASNSCGNDTTSTFLIVQYKPENFQFAASNIEVCQDEVINFTCSADGNPAVHTYQLFENDSLMTDGSNSRGMWNRTMSTGGVFIYKCVANNTAGTGQSESVTVNVNVPSTIQPIQNVNITEGRNLTLLCNASGIPPPMVSWIKIGSDMNSNGSELVFTNISRIQAGDYRCEASNECGNASETATIEVQYAPDNVQLETSAVDNKACRGDVISINCSADAVPPVTSYQLFENDSAILDTSGMWTKNFTTEGVFIYKCVANNSLGTGESRSVTVTVNVASSIKPIKNQTIMEGGSVTLTCNASGTPPPMVSWIKVGGGMSTIGKELVFTNINRSEAGEYRCEASNECGDASETATIEVQFKPDNVQLETSVVGGKACLGDVISINCSADAVPSEISYQLLENGIAILNASGRWSRKLTTAGVFTYTCVANNTLGTGDNASVTVTVNVPSSIQLTQNKSITEEGENVTVSCNASGTPPVMVSWIKVGSEKRFDGSELVFTNITRSEAGEYRCEASNECGNASETATIEVQYKPENVQLETSAADSKACKNEIISINCSADAVPSVASYELLENGSVILDTSGMWSRTLSSGGVFIYKCVANNSLGSIESESVTVTVNVRSTIQSIQNETITEGGSLTLTCNASGTPPPVVSWITVGSGMSTNGNELVFTNINRSEAGEYRCEASNECGNASETATIDVQYPPENVQFKISAANNKACVGETISINCSAVAVPSVASYELLENGSVILNTSGMWSRTLSSEGVFIYKCVANNSLGSAESESVTVTVNVPSAIQSIQNETITEGGSLTLTCNVSGTPPPVVSWITVGSGMSTNGNELVFTNINRSEAGEYRCEASNECGNASETVGIFIQYMPEITSISDNQTLNKGDSVSLNCTADGYPTPSITWTKVSDNNPVSFPLTINGKQNEGLYRCTAGNGIGSPVSDDVAITVHLPASIESLKNKTNLKKGGNVTLDCDVSGTPTPRVSWTRVSTGEKRLSKTWVIRDIKVENLGEYKCEASNSYGNDSKIMFISFPGGLCEDICSDGKSCREFGQYVCLCKQGKTGKNCGETESLKKTFEVGIEFDEKFKSEYEDLENPTTIEFVNKIKDAVTNEVSGSGVTDVKVTKLREGSVIADMELTFEKTVGKSEVDALLSEAAKDNKIGDLGVKQVVTDGLIEEPKTEPEECGTFFEGEDCKKAKPGLIALCVVGAVAVLAVLVAIIAYFVRKNKSNEASFSNGNYGQRVEPEGYIANGGRDTGRRNHGSVNRGYEHDRTNGHSYPAETPMVTFRNTNPAETPGIAINDSSVTQ